MSQTDNVELVDKNTESPTALKSHDGIAVTAAAAALLAGCGGGGSGGGGDGGSDASSVTASEFDSESEFAETASTSASSLTISPEQISNTDAARFLMQAGFSVPPGKIQIVKELGYQTWLDRELNRPAEEETRLGWITQTYSRATASLSPVNPIDRRRPFQPDLATEAYMNSAVWRKLITSPYQLRQRMVLALSEIFVVSVEGFSNFRYRGLMVAHYADLLEKHAFGNYFDLLKAITLSPAMGFYLNMRGNKKADVTGRMPDENYAREILQLFSIGLVMLNSDGTPQLDVNGKPIPTYTQADITELAKVFTGWNFYGPTSNYMFVKNEMVCNSDDYEKGEKKVLGQPIQNKEDPKKALDEALGIIANHPNVGPFIGRQLIQRFVKSHPSPEYVARVASAFNNNGRGERGDLKATLRAVLLDQEARAKPGQQFVGPLLKDTFALHYEASGRLREPIQCFIQWARTFGVTSITDTWPVGDTSDPANCLGQSPFNSPTVFNFFRPGYVPAGTGELAKNRATVPELQLCNENTVASYLNYMLKAIDKGVHATNKDIFLKGEVGEIDMNTGHRKNTPIDLSDDMKADYSKGSWKNFAALSSLDLLKRLNLLLAANAISAKRLRALAEAVESIKGTTTGTTDEVLLKRIKAAIFLVMAAPEYLVQK